MVPYEALEAAYRRQKKRASDARRLLRQLEALHAAGDMQALGELLVRWRTVLDPRDERGYRANEGTRN